MKILLSAIMALIALPFSASAADGAVCTSAVLTYTSAGVGGTTNYPVIDGTTKFTCNSTIAYTVRQLSQGGWIVDNLGTDTVSTTVNSNGTTTFKVRHRLTIQQ